MTTNEPVTMIGGWALYLNAYVRGGYSYAWKDRDGVTLCCGYVMGTRREVIGAAQGHRRRTLAAADAIEKRGAR